MQINSFSLLFIVFPFQVTINQKTPIFSQPHRSNLCLRQTTVAFDNLFQAQLIPLVIFTDELISFPKRYPATKISCITSEFFLLRGKMLVGLKSAWRTVRSFKGSFERILAEIVFPS